MDNMNDCRHLERDLLKNRRNSLSGENPRMKTQSPLIDMRKRQENRCIHTEKLSKDGLNIHKVYNGWISF